MKNEYTPSSPAQTPDEQQTDTDGAVETLVTLSAGFGVFVTKLLPPNRHDFKLKGDKMQREKINSGNRNSGDFNSGDWNSGDWNSGNRNSGDFNTGDWNSGERNSGNINSGNFNSGNFNSGNWNSGNWNSGFFNTSKQEYIFLFNKPVKKSALENVRFPDFLYFELTEWVPLKKMTPGEKNMHPGAEIAGGYLKTYEYKEAFRKSFEEAKRKEDWPQQLALLKAIPNFDAKIFEEISGINEEELV